MHKQIINSLENLVTEYNLETNNKVLKGLIPILWFGDLDKYKQSELRVVTASLNPSNAEFGNINKGIPYTTQFRFPDYNGSIESLITAYNNYFKYGNNPYNAWFKGSFNSVLESFNASHYDNGKNIAIHTDIAIPYATDPTWSGLNKVEKSYFELKGQRIWHELISILEPDIILISASSGYQHKIQFPKKYNNWETILQKEKHPVLYNQVKIDNKDVDIIFQTQGRKPFLNLTKDLKLNLYQTLQKFKNGKA